jgi:5'-3' exoribonuclease 1
MGVLPAASSNLIPEAYRVLMTDTTSPIIDFYPTTFELDLNGKKQDWESVVKIPFIDEERLIKALKSRESQLTKEEKRRNGHNHAWMFISNPHNVYHYASTTPSFPDIPYCTAVVTPYYINQPPNLVHGLVPGTRLGIDMFPGFPSMETIPHTATLGFHGVNVFNTESLRESMVVTVQNRFEGKSVDEVAYGLIGTRVYVGWPFLIEALVTSVSDELFKYTVEVTPQGRRDVVKKPQSQEGQDKFYEAVERIEATYSKRFGAIIGPVETIVGVSLLKGG